MACPIFDLFRRAGRADLRGVERVTIPMRTGDLPLRLEWDVLRLKLEYLGVKREG